MSNDKIAIIVWVTSILTVAVAMELTKAFKEKARWFWTSLSVFLSAVGTLSVWFGLEHTGNCFLLPIVLIAGWLAQYVVDMLGVKKVFLWVFNGMAKKYGYEKIKE